MKPGRRSTVKFSLNHLAWAVIGVGILGTISWLLLNPEPVVAPIRPAQTAGQPPTISSYNTATPAPAFNKQLYSLDDPNSIWVVVNKARPLNPLQYVPPDLVTPTVPLRLPGNQTMELRKVAAGALEMMVADAKHQGINLMMASGYRSYSYQMNLYNGYVTSTGQAAADMGSARPGHSEHQTGLAADLEPVSRNCELNQCFATTPEGQWLAANAYQYGFVIRYPADKTTITGYEPEPWHVRYIGLDLAAEMHAQHMTTLEEFFGLPAAPNYPSP